MDNACTVRQRYIGVTGNKEGFLILPCSAVCRALVQRIIFFVFQVLSLICLKNLVSWISFFCQFAKDRIKKSDCHVVYVSICCLHLCIVFLRIYAKADIGWQCPRRGSPCKEIRVFAYHLETNDRRAFLHVFIALGYFLCGKRGSAARAVRHDLKALVKQALIPDLFKRPPLGLNKVIMIGNIWVFHISPEPYRSGEIFPHTLVFPYAFLTFVDEWLQAIFFNLIFSIQAQRFFYFQFYRQPMGIPSCLARHLISLHRAVSWNHILDNASEHMADMRLAVGCGRAVIEHIDIIAITLFHALFKDAIFFPEFFNFFFSVYKIQVR